MTTARLRILRVGGFVVQAALVALMAFVVFQTLLEVFSRILLITGGVDALRMYMPFLFPEEQSGMTPVFVGGQPSQWAIEGIISLAASVLFIVVLLQLRRVTGSLARAELFVAATVQQIRRLGSLLLLLGCFHLLLTCVHFIYRIFEYTAWPAYAFQSDANFNSALLYFFMGGMLALAARTMDNARRIRDELGMLRREADLVV